MSRSSYLLPLLGAAAFAAALAAQPALKVHRLKIKGDGPANPGWMDQYRRMKADDNGKLPNIAALYPSGSYKTSATNLAFAGELGPNNVGGRTRSILIDWSDTNHFYAGGVSGGLWQSFDAGISWAAIDDQAESPAVVAIAQDPSDANRIYYATGEVVGNSADLDGHGIFVSTNAGVSFSQLPATANFGGIHALRHHPTTPGILYCGTSQNGLQRSLDSGATWKRIIPGVGFKEVTDVEIHDDGSVVMGVQNRGVFHSPTGDSNSFILTPGIDLPVGRVAVAVCRMHPDTVYALTETSGGGYYSDFDSAYLSIDSGKTFTGTPNHPRKFDPTSGFYFPWYAMLLEVNPRNGRQVIVGSANAASTTDAGMYWTELGESHADYHTAVWNGANAIVGNDGGLWRYSSDLSQATSLNNGYNVTQFYAGAIPAKGLNVMGGTQDNGTQYNLNQTGVFAHIFGGDGAFCDFSQQDSNLAYLSYQNGTLHRTFDLGSLNIGLNPQWDPVYTNGMDDNGDWDIDDGAWFINPFLMNPLFDAQLFHVTRRRVFVTNDAGANFVPSTDYLDGSGRSPYALGMSRSTNPTLYIGGEQGLFFRVDDAANPLPGTEVDLGSTLPLFAKSSFISCIRVHPTQPGTIYVAMSNYTASPRLYKVTGANTTTPIWTSLMGDLPLNLPVNSLDFLTQSPDSFLAIGTDIGLYTTVDGGVTWNYEDAVPRVPVREVRIREFDGQIVAWTHGRGAFKGKFDAYKSLATAKPNAPVAQARLLQNPAITQVSAALPDGAWDVEVFSANGRHVASQRSAKGQYNLAASHLAAGIYYVNLRQGRQSQTLKALVVK